jgi:hypothetical protein
MRSAGMTAPSSRVAKLWVARMPSRFQSPTASWPPAARSRKPCTSRGLPGSLSSRPKMPTRIQAGDRDVKILVPVKAQEPSARGTAAVHESNMTRSLPASRGSSCGRTPRALGFVLQRRLRLGAQPQIRGQARTASLIVPARYQLPRDDRAELTTRAPPRSRALPSPPRRSSSRAARAPDECRWVCGSRG